MIHSSESLAPPPVPSCLQAPRPAIVGATTGAVTAAFVSANCIQLALALGILAPAGAAAGALVSYACTTPSGQRALASMHDLQEAVWDAIHKLGVQVGHDAQALIHALPNHGVKGHFVSELRSDYVQILYDDDTSGRPITWNEFRDQIARVPSGRVTSFDLPPGTALKIRDCPPITVVPMASRNVEPLATLGVGMHGRDLAITARRNPHYNRDPNAFRVSVRIVSWNEVSRKHPEWLIGKRDFNVHIPLPLAAAA